MIYLIVAVLLFIVEVILLQRAMKVIKKMMSGRVFVKCFLKDRVIRGWISYNMLSAIKVKKKAMYEFIEIEHSNSNEYLELDKVIRLVEVKSILSIVIGDLG